MTEVIFGFLDSIGFTHPVHPAFTHIPVGLVMGAVIFRLVSFLPRMQMLAKTAYHCVILALVGIAPTIFTGYLDWQHRYGGDWKFLIVLKMVLAAVLTVLLLLIAFKDDPDNRRFDRVTGWYVLMMLVVIGLGYSGGELLHG
jgi:uncharacterized membrane protein